ncbi:MAG: DJ-1/PfpI family protein [Flavobacteriaceae bacterium]|jgi:transcriptional regulator GlxA family with amidase domain|nr:DJ-1/PfpI family protein [Flavobacteriaceae bacterium]
MKKNVGILIFENVEVLDFAGPFEVFSVSSEIHNHSLFNTFLISETLETINTINGMSVQPKYNFENAPHIDILIIPGGAGTKIIKDNSTYLKWIKKTYLSCEYMLSICSGARIIANLGMLKNKPFCTHQEVYDEIVELEKTGLPQKNKRYTHFDNVYTSGGISAGIDLSFEILKKIHGNDITNSTIQCMEYNLNFNTNE